MARDHDVQGAERLDLLSSGELRSRPPRIAAVRAAIAAFFFDPSPAVTPAVQDAAVRRPGIVRGQLWHGPGMVRRALRGGRRAPIATLLAVVLVVAVVGPMLWARLYARVDLRMVDLAVYRSAGVSLLHGRSVYEYLTPVPQLLAFTYPPFAAILAIPLGLMSEHAADWVWSLGCFGVLCWIVLVAFRPFVRRFAVPARPLVMAGVVSVVAWFFPVRDCFRFGQVGIFLAALCLLDCVLPRTRWPRGLMIGVATAIKLVPGAFIPYLWLTGRRRAAAVATAWFVGLTLLAAVALPQASKAYWTSAFFDSSRIGNIANPSNQSLRGIVARVLPGAAGLAAWALAVCVVVVFCYRWARAASFAGAEVRAVAIVGLLSVLVSPVSWIHHLAGFVPIAIGVVLGDARVRSRVALAFVLAVYFMLELPWYGSRFLGGRWYAHISGRLLQDAFGLAALFAVVLLGRMGAGRRVRMSDAVAHRDVSG